MFSATCAAGALTALGKRLVLQCTASPTEPHQNGNLLLLLHALQVDYVARYLRGWRIELPQLPGLQGLQQVHELHPEPFGGMQVRWLERSSQQLIPKQVLAFATSAVVFGKAPLAVFVVWP
jgi:hypothetical protein